MKNLYLSFIALSIVVFASSATAQSIDGVPIGSTTPSTGNFTTLEANSFALPNIDNTPIGENIRSTGKFTTLEANSFTLPNIDNTPIGSTTESTGKFTTLEATSSIKLGADTITDFDDIANEKVKTSVSDSTAGFLQDELQAGTNVTLTEVDVDGNKKVSIAVSDKLTTKGDVLFHNGTSEIRLPVGGSGQYLTSDTSNNILWANPAEGDQLFNSNVMLNAYRTAVNSSTPAVLKMIDGVVDAFVTEAGVDDTASNNNDYDSSNDFYSNPSSGLGLDVLTGGTITVNSGTFANVVDDDTGTAWQGGSITNCWAKYDFGAGNAVTPVKTRIFPADISSTSRIKNFRIEGSDTGSFSGEETIIHTNLTTSSFGAFQEFSFTNSTAFRFIRLFIVDSQNTSTFCGVNEWELIESQVDVLAGGTITVNSGTFANVVDDDTGTAWQGGSITNCWAKYDFGAGNAVTPVKTRIFPADSSSTSRIKNFRIEGSDTGSFSGEETIIHTNLTTSSIGAFQEFSFTNSIAFRFIRLFIVDSQSTSIFCGVNEWELIEGSVQDMTLISESQDAKTAPTGANILLLAEDVNANIIINTDIKASVSRDGGITFTQVTLSDAGEFEKGNLLTGTVDISSQPSGSSMVWEVKTENEVAVNLHGVGLEWR